MNTNTLAPVATDIARLAAAMYEGPHANGVHLISGDAANTWVHSVAQAQAAEGRRVLLVIPGTASPRVAAATWYADVTPKTAQNLHVIEAPAAHTINAHAELAARVRAHDEAYGVADVVIVMGTHVLGDDYDVERVLSNLAYAGKQSTVGTTVADLRTPARPKRVVIHTTKRAASTAFQTRSQMILHVTRDGGGHTRVDVRKDREGVGPDSSYELRTFMNRHGRPLLF